MNEHQFETVIFDFDYTLADPSPGVEACVNFALSHLNLPVVPAEHVYQTIGLSLKDTFLQLAGPAHQAQYDEFLHLFVSRANQVMINLTTLYNSTPATIKRLQAWGVKLGIVSMKYRGHIEPVLQRENLLDAFGVIIGGDDISNHKPHPEGIKMAMAQLGSLAATSIYVGDSLTDAEAAHRAGLPFVAVLSGATPKDAFNSYSVYHILDDLVLLPEWI